MNDECPHGLGDPAWCVLCNGRAKRERVEAAHRAATIDYDFVAKLDSTLSCGHDVHPGDQIFRMANESLKCSRCVAR